MSNFERKLKRTRLKQKIGSNKIKEEWHEMNYPLWKILKEKRNKNENKQN